ncbi:Mitochondrial import inner membrane translocase subunit Tim8 [Orchesella cincta]|uniref:Mitochondrial import inner membrane translocase subunit n=1 Tax=Orchesella cincta TaxID=48709 RepID=A0A1D2NLD5_ORCCI|nr:Mitochondrial import inner membrane translocase subunit Tim8 [Orchesella cincta]
MNSGFDTSLGSAGMYSGGAPSGSGPLEESLGGAGANAELQEFIAMEQQKQQLRATIQNLTDTCWEKCITGNPGTRLDSKTEACLENCVHRFFDVTVMIANRFASALQRQGGM